MKVRVVVLLVLAGVLSAALLEAQRQRFGFGPGSFSQREDPKTDFAIARWYSTGWLNDGWSHDYPDAEEHILQIMTEVSLIDTDRLSYKIVDLASPEIFKYIERGGFLMLDDFGGQNQGAWEMEGFRDILRRAFPGREMYLLQDNHQLLRISYHIDNLNMEHPMSYAKSVFYGFDDSKGRLAMVICYANDVGDYWEFIDQPQYRVKPSAEALKLGVNIALYSMTH
jgi:hypothetical protein